MQKYEHFLNYKLFKQKLYGTRRRLELVCQPGTTDTGLRGPTGPGGGTPEEQQEENARLEQQLAFARRKGEEE